MAIKLILIRHGQTNWNLNKRYCGLNDIGLNGKGIKQAKRLRKRLQKEIIHRVYCSDRRRALQTAKIIFNGAKIEKIPQLREMHFGCLEGLTHSQAVKRHAVLYRKWLSNPFNNAIPRAEDLRSFRKRVVSAFKKIIALNRNKTVAVVSHGGAISIFITYILKTKDFWKQIPFPATITVIKIKRDGSQLKVELSPKKD